MTATTNHHIWPARHTFSRDKRVIVTGGSGFLGSWAVDKLHARGAAELVAWGDGSPTREFLYVEDAAESILHIASAEVANAQFFVTSDDRLTRRYRRSGGSLQICDPIDFVRAVAGSER